MQTIKEIEEVRNIRQLVNINKKNFIDILASCLVVTIDTREKKIEHITKMFDEYKISYVSKKLDFGDYSFYLSKDKINENFNLSIDNDISFEKLIGVERKKDFNEIISNFTTNRERFEKEFKKAYDQKCEFRIIIEQKYSTLLKGKLRSKVSRRAIVASIFVFENVYNSNFVFLEKDSTACYIYNYFKYYLYSKIK